MREIACIGNRDIGQKAIEYLSKIGAWLVQNGYIVASGNADGSDHAFARGASEVNPSMVNLYLPWKDYNSNHVIEGNDVIVLDKYKHAYTADVVRKYHPAAERLTQGTMKLMCRNVLILKEARLCIAYQQNPGRGGTDFGIRLANMFDIPVINVATKAGQDTIWHKMDIQF